MNRSDYKQFASMSPEAVQFTGLVVGTGATPPAVAPTTFSATSSKGYMSAANNFVASTPVPTRSGVGAYTVTLKDSIPVVLDIDGNVWGPNGTTCTISDYNPQTKVITFLTWSPVGAAADLAATEFLRFTITGQLSVFP